MAIFYLHSKNIRGPQNILQARRPGLYKRQGVRFAALEIFFLKSVAANIAFPGVW